MKKESTTFKCPLLNDGEACDKNDANICLVGAAYIEEDLKLAEERKQCATAILKEIEEKI